MIQEAMNEAAKRDWSGVSLGKCIEADAKVSQLDSLGCERKALQASANARLTKWPPYHGPYHACGSADGEYINWENI